MTLKDGSAITITPDSATNRLKNDIHSPYTVDYDLNGNLTQYNTDTLSYDALGTLTRQNHDAGAQNFYLYNADDERVGFKDGGTGQWNWTLRSADDRVLRTYTSSDIAGTWTWSEDYFYAGGRLLAAERPSGRRHFHLDHLGSPRLITDNLRNTIAQHDFAPFGTELTSMRQEPAGGLGNADSIGFTGHERDFTGGTNTENEHYLDYMHARYYSAIVGRFLTVDGGPSQAVFPQTWNRYTYVGGNPMTFNDPDGMMMELAGSAEEQIWDDVHVSLSVSATDFPQKEDHSHMDQIMADSMARSYAEFYGGGVRRQIAAAFSDAENAMKMHGQVTLHAGAAFIDGVIPDVPFCDACNKYTDPFEGFGYYDVNDPGMYSAQVTGVVTREVMLAIASTGGTAEGRAAGTVGEFVKDNIFRWGKGSWKGSGGARWHFHANPLVGRIGRGSGAWKGSEALMRHHLPQQFLTWSNHLRVLTQKFFW